MSGYDYGSGPTEDQWARHGELVNSGFSGFDVQQRLPIILKTEIPWMRQFTVGFSTGDTPEWIERGWFPMQVKYFGTKGLDNFNKTVGLRFSLHSVDGLVRYKDHILMLKRIDDRDVQEAAQNQQFEEYFAKISKQGYSHPLDPRRAEMEEYQTAGLEEDVFIRDPGSTVAKHTEKRVSKKEPAAPINKDT